MHIAIVVDVLLQPVRIELILKCQTLCVAELAVVLELVKISFGLNPEMECTSTFYLV